MKYISLAITVFISVATVGGSIASVNSQINSKQTELTNVAASLEAKQTEMTEIKEQLHGEIPLQAIDYTKKIVHAINVYYDEFEQYHNSKIVGRKIITTNWATGRTTKGYLPPVTSKQDVIRFATNNKYAASHGYQSTEKTAAASEPVIKMENLSYKTAIADTNIVKQNKSGYSYAMFMNYLVTQDKF